MPLVPTLPQGHFFKPVATNVSGFLSSDLNQAASCSGRELYSQLQLASYKIRVRLWSTTEAAQEHVSQYFAR